MRSTGLAGSKRVYGNSSQYVRVYRAHCMSMKSINTKKSFSDIWQLVIVIPPL